MERHHTRGSTQEERMENYFLKYIRKLLNKDVSV
jgi:hypothetical protein